MVKFSKKLQKGTLVKRYKRFLADVTLADGETVTAHCPNTGSMKTCGDCGDTVYLAHHDDPKRKLKYTWELTRTKGGYIGVNTSRPNQVVEAAVRSQAIPELSGYETLRREVKYGTSSRIDLLLEDEGHPTCYVEIKNTTLLAGDRVVFPDAVTTRGLKHLKELTKLVKTGHRAVMFYFVNRPEGGAFGPAADIDPNYAKALEEAMEAGVEVLAYRSRPTLTGMGIGEPVEIGL